jgi:hypothetical protein
MYVLYAVCFSLAYGMRQLLEEQQTSAQFDRRRLSGSGVTFQKWLRCGGRLCDEEARCCAWCVVFNLLQCVFRNLFVVLKTSSGHADEICTRAILLGRACSIMEHQWCAQHRASYRKALR